MPKSSTPLKEIDVIKIWTRKIAVMKNPESYQETERENSVLKIKYFKNEIVKNLTNVFKVHPIQEGFIDFLKSKREDIFNDYDALILIVNSDLSQDKKMKFLNHFEFISLCEMLKPKSFKGINERDLTFFTEYLINKTKDNDVPSTMDILIVNCLKNTYHLLDDQIFNKKDLEKKINNFYYIKANFLKMDIF